MLLRGDSGGSSGHFAIGLPSVAPAAASPHFAGYLAGTWTSVKLSPTTYATAPIAASGTYGADTALQDVAGGPPGLLQGVLADGSPLVIASDDALAVQIGTPGQLDIFGLQVPRRASPSRPRGDATATSTAAAKISPQTGRAHPAPEPARPREDLMSNFIQRAWPRRLRACVPAASLVSALAGCGGSGGGSGGGPLPQIELTATGAASTASVGRGDTATFVFTVSNPGRATVDAVVVTALPDSDLSVQGVTCTAQGGTCPPTSAPTPATFSMPPGSVFTFTVAAKALADLDGTVTMTLAVDSSARLGEVRAAAHTASVDGRDGGYLLLGSFGSEAGVDLGFNPVGPSFSQLVVAGSNTPGVTMTSEGDYFTLSPDGHLSTGADVVVGAHDFGAGLEPFIGTRNVVTDLAALDGLSFVTFNLPVGAAASAGSPVHGVTGPMGIWQASIAGTTLTLCTDRVGAIADCSAAGLRHYALSPTFGDTGRFDADDSVDGDFFTFQVARSGASLIWLRDAYGSDGLPWLSSVGLANPQAPAEEHDAYATLGGRFGVLSITATSWEFLAQNPAGDFGPSAVFPFTADSDAGIPGLLHGPRPSDGVEVYMAHQGALTLVGTLAGEFCVALDKP